MCRIKGYILKIFSNKYMAYIQKRRGYFSIHIWVFFFCCVDHIWRDMSIKTSMHILYIYMYSHSIFQNILSSDIEVFF
jgi:hypothetical protein